MKREIKILRLLKKEYPKEKVTLNFSNPLELLAATMLSAQSTDSQVNIVTKYLFKKYRKVSDYVGANLKNFEKDIHSIGLYQTKAKNIINSFKMIKENFNSKVPDTMEDLLKLPGVARKTANIVLCSGFGKSEGIAVDTHVARLSKRLGLSQAKAPDKIEKDLIKSLPKLDWSKVNILFITHGRKVCKARKPLCGECALAKLCLYYNEPHPEIFSKNICLKK